MPREFCREFPGRLDAAAAAREFVASALDGCPAAADAALCASEAVANAVTHTRSGEPGGTVRVCVSVADGGWVRLAVDDQGGPQSPALAPADPGAEHGRGLRLIAALAGSWHADGGPGGRTVRIQLPWGGSPSATALAGAEVCHG